MDTDRGILYALIWFGLGGCEIINTVAVVAGENEHSGLEST
jgi:hypothetical protein